MLTAPCTWCFGRFRTRLLILRPARLSKSLALPENHCASADLIHRPEQLVLQDDPSYLPEFNLPPPELLAELNLGLPMEPVKHSGESQELTPFGSQRSPSTPRGSVGRLIVPSSSSVDVGEFVVQGAYDPDSEGGAMFSAGFNEPMVDAEFMIDEDGGLIDLSEANVISGTPAARGDRVIGDARASAQVRDGHEAEAGADAEVSYSPVLCLILTSHPLLILLVILSSLYLRIGHT